MADHDDPEGWPDHTERNADVLALFLLLFGAALKSYGSWKHLFY